MNIFKRIFIRKKITVEQLEKMNAKTLAKKARRIYKEMSKEELLYTDCDELTKAKDELKENIKECNILTGVNAAFSGVGLGIMIDKIKNGASSFLWQFWGEHLIATFGGAAVYSQIRKCILKKRLQCLEKIEKVIEKEKLQNMKDMDKYLEEVSRGYPKRETPAII